MPSQWTAKQERKYEHIAESEKDQGRSERRAKEIAARTVNKERAQKGQSKTASRSSTEDMTPSQRGGRRSGTNRTKGRTREQLYKRGQAARDRGALLDEQGTAAPRRRLQEALMKVGLEREVKLRPGPGFSRFELPGRELAERSLTSTYYDTDDLRLAAGSITLRRRCRGRAIPP